MSNPRRHRIPAALLLALGLLLASCSENAEGQPAATLFAARPGGFAASPHLDAGATFHLDVPSTATLALWLARADGGAELPGSRREVTGFLPEGEAELRLADDGRFLWLVNLAPISDYRLRGEWSLPGADAAMLDPIAIDPRSLGEESADGLSRGASITRHRAAPGLVRGDGETTQTIGSSGATCDLFTHQGEWRDLRGEAPHPGDPIWLKTLEWRFNSSPYNTGWDAIPAASDLGTVAPWYATDHTQRLSDRIAIFERSPGLPRRIHRLRITTRSADGLTGGWRYINLFRDPVTDAERMAPGRDYPERAADLTGRLLRFDMILSASVRGDQIPPLRFVLEGSGVVQTFDVAALRNNAGEPLPSGDFTRVTWLVQPPHHLANADPRTLTFRFETTGHGAQGIAEKEVNLENLTVWETPIADLPPGAEARGNPWPAVAMLREKLPRDTAHIDPVGPTDPEYFLADHAIFQDAAGAWNLYGIYNSRTGFAPLDAKGAPNSNGPFHSGLVHALAPASIQGPWSHAAFSGTDRRTRDVLIDPDQPQHFFGPWAPSVARVGDEFAMFYTEHALWNPEKYDGIRYATTRTPGIPSSWKPWIPESPDQRLVYTRTDRNTARDLDVSRRGADWHAVWAGYKASLPGDADVGAGKVLHKMVAGDPRLLHTVPQEKERVIYSLHNADSGRIDSECESPTLVHDEAAGLFYLKVTKNGTAYPGHAFDNDVLLLDRERGAIVLAERTRGDRSDLIAREYPADPTLSFRNPIAMVPLENMPWWVPTRAGRGTFRYRYRVAVLDTGDPAGGVEPFIVEVDCIDGARRLMWRGSKDSRPTAMTLLVEPCAENDQRGELLVADSDSLFVVGTTGSATPRDILRGVAEPSAIHVRASGARPCAALLPIGETQFRVVARRSGLHATEYGGRLTLRLQDPLRPNSPLAASHSLHNYPDAVVSILLATDGEGRITTTLSDLLDFSRRDPAVAPHIALASPGDHQLATLVEPHAITLAGGEDVYTIYFAESTAAGERVVSRFNWLSSGDRSEPTRQVIARADFDWNPTSLLRRGGHLYIAESTRGAIHRLPLDDPKGPATLAPDAEPWIANLPDPRAFRESWTGNAQVYLATRDGYHRLDLEARKAEQILGNATGGGKRFADLVASQPVSWVIESIDAGAKVYWSRPDPATGAPQPFTLDHYIGYLPYYASELHRAQGRWFASFNETNREGGYGVQEIEWAPRVK